MQMIELLGMSHDDVAFYATPRPLLMMDTNSHYTTYTNATMEYLSRTIAPDGAEMEAECFRKFLHLRLRPAPLPPVRTAPAAHG